MWVDIINENVDEAHKFNGTGWLCHLHFSESDYTVKKNGQMLLKKGSVPYIKTSDCSQAVDLRECETLLGASYVNDRCDNCQYLTEKLNEEKKISIAAQTKFDIESYKQCNQLEELAKKYKDLQRVNNALIGRIADLEKLEKEHKEQIEYWQYQMLRTMNATSDNVITITLLVILIPVMFPFFIFRI